MTKFLVPTVCYEDIKGQTFLAYYTYKPIDIVIRDIDNINKNHINFLPTGEKINWGKIKKFFVCLEEKIT